MNTRKRSPRYLDLSEYLAIALGGLAAGAVLFGCYVFGPELADWLRGL